MNPDMMIALAGEQPMPNFIPILQIKPQMVEFVVSNKTEPHARWTTEAMKLDRRTKGIRTNINPQVEVYDLAAVERQCVEIIERYPDQTVVVNLTGGTKIMSLGAYRIATEHRLAMLYVVTEKSHVLYFEDTVFTQPLVASVPAQVYFAAHGIKASSKRPWGEPFVGLARLIAQHAVNAARVIDEARRCVSQRGQLCVIERASADERKLAQALVECGCLEPTGSGSRLSICVTQDRRARDFLAGKWLEIWVYEAARTSGLFDDVACDVRIEKDSGPALVLNQLDVVATRNARLTVCSCKTESHELTEKDENKGAIYELDSISRREQAGIYCGKVLVTHLVGLPEAFLSRAQNSRVTVVTGVDLINVAAKIGESLK